MNYNNHRLEQISKAIVEQLVVDGEYEEVSSRAEIRNAILAEFIRKLDGKIDALQRGEALAAKFRFDIVASNGKVRGGVGSNRSTPEYNAWRKAVYERENYACQECGSTNKINAHHVKSWRSYIQLRFDVDNGQTLCEQCHKEKHPHLERLQK